MEADYEICNCCVEYKTHCCTILNKTFYCEIKILIALHVYSSLQTNIIQINNRFHMSLFVPKFKFTLLQDKLIDDYMYYKNIQLSNGK